MGWGYVRVGVGGWSCVTWYGAGWGGFGGRVGLGT